LPAEGEAEPLLEIFPASSLDSSIGTPVLLGVVLVWLLQETLGWGLTGLVIPGYLASIMVVQPETGVLITFEAALTYAIVRALSESVPRWWPWAPFFGRDRFFHILMVSVAVRLSLESPGGLLDIASDSLGLPVLGDLNAMGLVLVPLMANVLWRSGLAQGLPRIGVPMAVTWALLEFVLLPYTNLNLSSFELTYEDLALDFSGSAKAHLLVLVGAWIAASANLHWGWDMGGIIVPGLLTLVWLEPSKVVVTLGEAVVVSGVLSAVVRLPVLRDWNLAGGRTLTLAFVLDYGLRTVVAWTPWSEAGLTLAAMDLQGFGYLLPTLLAVRMHQHREVLRVVLPVLMTSFIGFVVGTGIGFAVARLDVSQPVTPRAAPAVAFDAEPLLALVDAAESGGRVVVGESTSLDLDARDGLIAFEGGGAIHLRRGGVSDVVVMADLTSPGMAQAAWRLAALGNARAVFLCPRSAEGCETLRRALQRSELERWELVSRPLGSQLRVRRALPAVLTLRDIIAGFGPVTVTVTAGASGLEDDQPELVFGLDESARMRAAAQLFSPVETDWRELQQRAWSDEDLEQAGAARLRHVLPTLVLEPWVSWLHRGDEAALEAAQRAASVLDLDLAKDGTRSLLVAPWWRIRLERDAAPFAVFVPEQHHVPGAAALGDGLSRVLRASALVIDRPSPHPIGLDRRLRPAQLGLEVLALDASRRGRPPLGVVTVDGLRDVLDPESEAVVTIGRMVRADDVRPGVSVDVAVPLDLTGAVVRDYDGQAEVLGLTDSASLVRPLARVAGGGESQVTLLGTPRLRDALAPVDTTGHPLAFVAADATLPHVERSLAELAADVQPGAADLSPPVLASLGALVSRGRPVDLARLRWAAGARGRSVELVCEPELGCRWLRVGACGPAGCRGSLLPFHLDTTTTRQTDDPLAALLFDGTPIPVAWREAP